MVGAGDIVAHRLGRVPPQEDRAGMAHLRQQDFRIGGGDLQMLRRETGRPAARHRPGWPDHDDARHNRSNCSTAISLRGRCAIWRAGGFRHLVGKGGVVGDQDGLRRGIMLGLAEQIGGDPFRIVLAIGDHQNFRRAGDAIDADLAEDFALGGCDIGIAGADDLVDRR